MARKMKKFSEGGAQGRYERRMADIEKDYKKAAARKTGKDAEVAEAKRQQRIADAKDDLAKRTGADRTATRAAEKAAESNLTKTRKYGAPKAVTTEASVSAAPAATTEAAKAKPSSFKEAFKDARSRLGAGKTFTFGGKSYTTNIAGEGRKTVQKPVQKPVQKAAPTPEKKAAPEKAIAPSKFDKAAFADLKAKAAASKIVPAIGGTALRGRPGGTPLFRFGKDVTNSPEFKAKLADAKRAAEAPGAAQWRKDRYQNLLTNGMAKGGAVKKETTMKKSTPPQPTPAERAAGAKFRESIKNIKPTPAQGKILEKTGKNLAKGGKAKSFAATKFGAAMMKKSADTKGRAMVKKCSGGSMKKYASGGLVAGHKSADGIASKGKTKGKMV